MSGNRLLKKIWDWQPLKRRTRERPPRSSIYDIQETMEASDLKDSVRIEVAPARREFARIYILVHILITNNGKKMDRSSLFIFFINT